MCYVHNNRLCTTTVCAQQPPVHNNRLSSTRCTHLRKPWQCTDVLKMTINYGGTEFKNVNMFREWGKTTNTTDLSYGYIEDHIDNRKMKKLSNILFIVYYILKSGCYISQIFDLHILELCNLCEYMSCFPLYLYP